MHYTHLPSQFPSLIWSIANCSLYRLVHTFEGMMVVCTIFLNLPMLGSTSSGLIISSSSEKDIDRGCCLRFRDPSPSEIPTIEICLLWAVLYCVRSWTGKYKKEQDSSVLLELNGSIYIP